MLGSKRPPHRAVQPRMETSTHPHFDSYAEARRPATQASATTIAVRIRKGTQRAHGPSRSAPRTPTTPTTATRHMKTDSAPQTTAWSR